MTALAKRDVVPVFPWRERAIAVTRLRKSDPFSAEVLAQGNLAHVVAMIAALPLWEQMNARVSMPYRAEHPFMFQGAELRALIAAWSQADPVIITPPPGGEIDQLETR